MKLAEPLHIGGVVIEEVDYRALNDEQIVLTNALGNILRAEATPEDPPAPVELTAAEIRNLPAFYVVRTFWGLDPDGNLVADGFTYWTDTDDNRHLAWVGIEIHPQWRMRGIGRTMLGLLADAVEAEGRTLLMGGTSSRVPSGEVFARRLGAEPVFAMHTNRLLLADVDRHLIDAWISDGPRRAPDYELITIDSPYPDERLEEIVALMDVMNTAPRDDMQVEDRHLTVDQVRQFEQSWRASGLEVWALFAVHRPSGAFAGYTEVRWNPHQPETIWQGDTGVMVEHRGHALGKWLKATMLKRIFADRPRASDVRTGNADSNAPMLGINLALGFRPYIAQTSWQISVEKARAYAHAPGGA